MVVISSCDVDTPAQEKSARVLPHKESIKIANQTGLFNKKTPEPVHNMAKQVVANTGFDYGKAHHKGDCFFSSAAQGITAVKQNPYTTKDMRTLLKFQYQRDQIA